MAWIEQYISHDLLVYALRIAIACVLGGAIGFERTKRLKEAGIRTHCIIASAAALMMILSKYGFADLEKVSGSFSKLSCFHIQAYRYTYRPFLTLVFSNLARECANFPLAAALVSA